MPVFFFMIGYNEKMRILFCGTPDFAVPSLKKLAGLSPAHEVVGVVSQPDRRKGRSGAATPPPVVAAALEMGIPSERIFQPRSINAPEILEGLRALRPDLLCVIAYGNILKTPALELAAIFPINAHASLLPKYRGAAPIQAALLNGDAETGVCVMKMEAGLDTGPVLLRRAISIDARETAGTLHDKLALLSADCFVESIAKIAAKSFTLEAQDDARATYAGKLEKSSGSIDWSQNAEQIERLVRAMTPWPGAWARVSAGALNFRVRVAQAELHPPEESAFQTSEGARDAGMGMDWKRILFNVVCGDGKTLSIRRIQPEGKREMTVSEFLRGAGLVLSEHSNWSRA